MTLFTPIDLPKLISESYEIPDSDYLLILASGFEDRTKTVLDKISKKPPKAVLLIIYQGEKHLNKDDEIRRYLKSMRVSTDEIYFDRRNPQPFEQSFEDYLANLKSVKEILIDISVMSKLLIMTLLVGCQNFEDDIMILYTEPRMYKPTKAQFEAKKRYSKLAAVKLSFQTSDVAATITTRNLSSIAMDNSPIFLVGFPTFNEDLLIILFHEFSPNAWVIVHGKPLREKDQWRLNAIKYMNRHILEQIQPTDQIVVSTFHYEETFNVLENSYHQFKHTHKIIIGPPVSKLQAVAISIFKLYRPDVQILYPTPKSYLLHEHSLQAKAIHMIKFKRYAHYIKSLIESRLKVDAYSPVRTYSSEAVSTE